MHRGRELPVAHPSKVGGFLLPPRAQGLWRCSLPWTPLLPLAHTDPQLTLLPRSLEISAAFMAAMRPSIMSEGATMWQPAGKERGGQEVPGL